MAFISSFYGPRFAHTVCSLTGSRAKRHRQAFGSFDTQGGIDAMRRHTCTTSSSSIHAFTIVELLAVFSQARKKSYQSVCATNLRQISVASAAYAQDCDECLVPAGSRYPHQPMPCYECGNNPACITSPYWSSPYAWVDWGPA